MGQIPFNRFHSTYETTIYLYSVEGRTELRHICDLIRTFLVGAAGASSPCTLGPYRGQIPCYRRALPAGTIKQSIYSVEGRTGTEAYLRPEKGPASTITPLFWTVYT